jgi:dTDP-glucose pyrophosphorylase
MQPVGIVPAAGHARRLQPLPCSKEMYPVYGRPVIDFLLDRLRCGGCSDIRVVTRPEKDDVARHAAGRGATIVLGRPDSVAESMLAGMQGLSDDDIVAMGFPDTIWEPVDGFARLFAHLGEGTDIVLGLFRVDQSADCDRVEVDGSGAIRSIRVKPSAPRADLTWGCLIARVGALRDLEGEAEPGRYFHLLRTTGRLSSLYLSDRFVDIGTREALERLSSSADL